MNIYIPTRQDIRETVQEIFDNFKPIKLPEQDDFLTKEDVGGILKIGNTSVDNLRRRGILIPFYIGGCVRYRRSQVMEAVSKMKKKSS